MMTFEETFLMNKIDPCINELFSKTFLIVEKENYSLPSPDRIFKKCPWYIKELQTCKEQLNEVKNRLNSFHLDKWHKHTNKRNKAAQVLYHVKKNIEAELPTQAWCKFYEILSFFHFVPMNEIQKNNNSFTSVHLCEAPGAFVTSLNHWLKINTDFNWNWLATTLNPYYEGNSSSSTISDDRFIINTLNHWCFCEDNTGNLMDLKNLNFLVNQAKVNDNILLITADGSINCMDVPAEQEATVSKLHYCEIVAALHLLNKGGSFLIKIFTIFEYTSICSLYLLACCFNTLYVTKPATSKEGNSETYVVCIDFKGPEYIAPYLPTLQKYYETVNNTAMFCKEDIPSNFIEKIIKCSQFFKEHQARAITNNIISFTSNKEVDDITCDIKIIQKLVAKIYLNYCNLQPLPFNCKIMKKNKNNNLIFNFVKVQSDESYDMRCEKANKSLMQRLIEYRYEINEIYCGVLMSEPYKFQFTNKHIVLEYCTGKPFYRVFNSKFYNIKILNIQNEIENILDELQLKSCFPSDEDTVNLLQELNITPSYITLCFQYTDLHYNSTLISKIYELLCTFVIDDNLVLIGYSLLTRLNISLLYLLNYTFESMELIPHKKVGCLIILKNYKNNANIFKMWEKIVKTDKKLRTEGKTILSLIPISHLCDWKAYSKIVECNHWIFKTYLNYIINNAMERINIC
ncbi:PREDICTED: cap-specific mRNA (nucleoside-2'-O-)-methyltransferase 2 [Polistes canadensis]|uniref:cap-specific mRNA (nucleoside-2'-O-)-methyltransferase 2 n=1 Tax=Polistes canadensis TaxID=91411 RepID=UPI000718EC3C|nr:PREDICTED: cap-specific mRNA (nucleoside-2'-O-)-methyltransferase 2 [Polistes canadensis]